MRRWLRIAATAATLVLSTAAVAAAGSIPVVTFSEVPAEFDAGTPYQLDYSILAHGKAPMDLEATSIRFRGHDRETVRFPGISTEKGRWTAEITLPAAGEWLWEIVAGGNVLQTMGALSVKPPLSSASSDLLTSLRIGLPIATVLAHFLLVRQVAPRAHLEPRPSPTTDVV